MARSFNPRWLLGRTIVGVEMNAFSDGRGGKAFSPVLFFDNGACVSFMTQETEDGAGYGTLPIYTRRARQPNPSAVTRTKKNRPPR